MKAARPLFPAGGVWSGHETRLLSAMVRFGVRFEVRVRGTWYIASCGLV